MPGGPLFPLTLSRFEVASVRVSGRGGYAWNVWLVAALAAGVGCFSSEPEPEPNPSCGQIGRIDVIEAQVTVDPGHTRDVSGQGYNDCDPEAAVTTTGWVWTSDDPSVATVAPLQSDPTKARISGIAEGTTMIRAEVAPPAQAPRSYTDHVAVTVNPLGSLTVTPPSAALTVGESLTLTAHARDQGGSDVTVPVTWTSDDPTVASVSGTTTTATLTAVAAGATVVTATVGSVSVDVPVAVAEPSAFITGTMFGEDDVTGLAGMRVGSVVTDANGVFVFDVSVMTDANGRFTFEVTPGEVVLLARGVCDPLHACNHELSFNAIDLDTVQVAPGETKAVDVHARSGYHLVITSGATDRAVQPGATFQVQLGYRIWSRSRVPGAVHRLVAGIDSAAGPAPFIGVTGVYPGLTDVVTLDLTAPATPGDYGVYLHLPRTSNAGQAQDRYRDGFADALVRADEFIRALTLKVCAAAPNCP